MLREDCLLGRDQQLLSDGDGPTISDSLAAWNLKIDWSQFEVNGPRSVEIADIVNMVENEVFPNSYENICRLDTLATR